MTAKKQPKKSKAQPVKEWLVPMTYEYRGKVIVKARTEYEAYRAAQGGEFAVTDGADELINWAVIGTPELND